MKVFRLLTLQIVYAVSLLGIFACSDNVVNPVLNDGTAIWRIMIDHRSVVLARGQTLKLTATPRGVNGVAIPSNGTVRWSSSDLTSVTVDSTGIISANAIGGPVSVIVVLTDLEKNITVRDTSLVMVTETVQPISSFGFVLPSPGDQETGAGSPINLPVQTISGTTALTLPFRFTITPRNRAVMYPAPTGLSGASVDTGTFSVSLYTYAYGTEYRDSVTFVVGPTTLAGFLIMDGATAQSMLSTQPGIVPMPSGLGGNYWFRPLNVTVKVGGMVRWGNYSGASGVFPPPTLPPVTVNFDRLTGIVPAENVSACQFFLGCAPMRQFTQVGVYHWSSPDSKQFGTITVVP